MAYDDIASSSSNPFKGHIYHTTSHSQDVYPGTEKIDYKGKTVTAESFYAALKAVPTTSEDYLFIYYDNHGGTGILGVPDGCGGYITASDLNKALNAIPAYKKAFFGIEACEAGSVAQEFNAPNLGTITASNPTESSYAAVYDSQMGTYLSNEFTNYWLADMIDNPTETVGELFTNVKTLTTGSHAMYYGDESVKDLSVTLFFGDGSKSQRKHVERSKVQDIVPPKVATMRTLESLKTTGAKDVRSRARLSLLRMQSRSEKLEVVLDALIGELETEEPELLRQPTATRLPKGYFETLEFFLKRFGKVNPDDMTRFMIIKNLVAKFGSKKVMAAIDEVL